ncbi:Glycosyl transferase family 2 [Chitinophaga rupis]|uniref:Glycosyl transferase family 2 n=1 Tax=Chitinophaga rupis TaxID=573321 RepID=A0A1H7LQ40_9BACT|nr:glycosyltransferase family 2 protein [Chitinophaga rupis]SEL01061.1 Glycosyl transferase family 2 [Chitinophaga rupis]
MKKRRFSIIVPTYGRFEEVFEFLDSVTRQTYDNSLIEVLVVDQNDKIDLAEGLKKYDGDLNIKHFKVTVKGIAHAKNVGVKNATGEILTFADDDSKYYPETIEAANECFNTNPAVDMFYGKVFDRSANRNLIRNWKQHAVKITKFNYHHNYIAIACFTSIKLLFFDERFGVGTKYGVGEELDYLLQALDKQYEVYYTPLIDVWHPQVSVHLMTKEKVYYYAKGYGAICRKHRGFPMLWNLMVSSSFQLLSMLLFFITFRFNAAYTRYLAFAGRIKGYIEFK